MSARGGKGTRAQEDTAMAHSIFLRLLTPTILSIVVFLLGCRTEEHGNWITYKSGAGDYIVRFPEQPDESTTIQEDVLGITVPRHICTCGADDKRRSYMVEWQEFPNSIAEQWTDVPALLVNTQEGLIAQNSATLHSERPVKLGKYVGREFIFQYREKSTTYFVLARMCIVENRMYHVNFTTTTSLKEVQQAGVRFADSFELLPQ